MTDTAGSRERQRRLVTRGGIALVVLLGLRALLPLGLQHGLAWGIERELGLPARVGNVDLWLLRGAAAIEDVVVASQHEADDETTPDAERALIRWDRVFANLEWTALLTGELELSALEIDGPQLRLEREADGRIDPLGPRASPAPAESAEVGNEETDSWPVLVTRFTLRTGVVELVNADDDASLARLGVEELDLEDVGIRGEQLSLGGFALRGPTLQVQRELILGDGTGADPPASEEPNEPAPGSASAAASFEIDRIEIERASFTLQTASGPLELAIGLLASEIAARPGHQFPLHFDLEIGDGSLALEGRVGLDPPSYSGNVRWSDFPLPPLSLLQTPELLPWLRSCRAGGDVEVDFRLVGSAEAPAGISLHGVTSIDDFSFVDPDSEELALEWQALEITTREAFYPLDGGAAQLTLERVSLVRPRVHYTNPPRALARLLGMFGVGDELEAAPSSADPAVAEDGSSEPPIIARIDLVEVTDGVLGYRDLTVSPTVDVAIEKLSMEARGVQFPELTAESLRMSGVAPRAAPFTLTGRIGQRDGDVEFTLERMALVPFDPFAGELGYEIARGRTTLRTQIHRRGDLLEVDNQLVLHDMNIGTSKDSDFEGSFGVPIDLALALLRDPSGDIALAIPLSFEGSVMQVGIGTLLLSALRDALIGAITAPLKLAGAFFGEDTGGSLGFDPLEFAPGSSQPADPERIAGLGRLLAERAGLRLALIGRSGDADRESLAGEMLFDRMQAGKSFPDVEGSGFFARRRVAAAIERRAVGKPAVLESEDEALLQRYIAAIEIPSKRYEQLALRRTEMVREQLVAAGADPERIALATSQLGAQPSVAFELGAGPTAAP